MYGSPEGVAALAGAWTEGGEWLDANVYEDITATNPSLTTVTEWLTNISAQMDLALSTNWFVTPVDENTSPVAHASISQYVNELAASLAFEANGVQGPSSGRTLLDMLKWVEQNADGFVADGMAQTPTPSTKRQARMSVLGTLPSP